MIRLKEPAASSSLDDALQSLARLISIRENEGWKKTHDVTVVRSRDRLGGYKYTATTWMAKAEG